MITEVESKELASLLVLENSLVDKHAEISFKLQTVKSRVNELLRKKKAAA